MSVPPNGSTARIAWRHHNDRLMIFLAVAVPLLRLCNACSAPAFEPFNGPAPRFVYIESDPWAMVVGSDTPRIVLYEDGARL